MVVARSPSGDESLVKTFDWRPRRRGPDEPNSREFRLTCSGVSELALAVADLERAEAFYAGTLGLPIVERWPDAVWVMAGERTRIGLWLSTVPPLAGERGGAHVHFALHLDEVELDRLVEHLEQRGAPFKLIEFSDGRGRAAYVTDPDGHVVEFWTWDVAGQLAGRAG